MEGKRAAAGWTVGKLLSIILLTILLALIIYGITTKGLNPLIDKVGIMFDQVLIFFNIREGDIDNGKCYNSKVSSLSNGPEFLDSLEIESGGGEIEIDICQNGICTLDIGGNVGNYRLNDGVFEKEIGEDWIEFKNGRFIQRLSSSRSVIRRLRVLITEKQLDNASWKTYNLIEVEGTIYPVEVDDDKRIKIDVGTPTSPNFQYLRIYNEEHGFEASRPHVTISGEDPKSILDHYFKELDISKRPKEDMEENGVAWDEIYNLQEKKYEEDSKQWTLIKEFIRSKCG
tara:strand:- start:6973 stop:7830 length:858 start_codon:yes stop_codon:yes gene_type:complete